MTGNILGFFVFFLVGQQISIHSFNYGINNFAQSLDKNYELLFMNIIIVCRRFVIVSL